MLRISCIFLLILMPALVFSQAGYKKKSYRYGMVTELLRGPYLQVATPGSMMIRWRTDEADISRVRYGTAPDRLDQVITDERRVWEHQVTITALQPLTKYYYQIEGKLDTLQGDENNHFTTLPLAGVPGNYRIGIFGDCGNNSINQRNTLARFEEYLDDSLLNAWILLGDNAYSFGKDAEYQSNFFNIYKDKLLKTSPLFPAPGNHDYHDIPFYPADYAQQSKEIAYYQSFSMPVKAEAGGTPSGTQAFYSYDIGNIHFLSLDSHGTEDSASRLYDTLGRQVRWIKKDLEANKNKAWIVAYWHHPPYSMGSHNSDTESQMVKIRQNFVRILERYGVDLILCGHSHSYERSALMQGHYGMEQTFNTTLHNIPQPLRRQDSATGHATYIKDASNKGTVYVVSGSAGQLGGQQKTFPHDAMAFSDATHGGASILEVQGNQLTLKWICADGVIRDQFTIIKEVGQQTASNANKRPPVFVNKPQLVRGPYLQAATDTSIVVRWRTATLTRSRVRYGISLASLHKTVDALPLTTEHEIKLTGLAPYTKYYYAIGSLSDTLQYGEANYFYTLPPTGSKAMHRIGVFGDCGYLSLNQAQVRDAFVNYLGDQHLNAWLLLGDNAYNDGSDLEYQAKFFTVYQDQLLKKYPVFPCPGNHDYHDVDFTSDYAQEHHTTPYYQNFSMPAAGEAGGLPSHNPAFYSFNIGNIHFLSLDSYGREQNQYYLYDTLGPQVQWIKKDLDANKNKDWVVLYWHHPPYSMGTHNSDSDGIMTAIRENFLPILERYGVDLILCGHSHVYERSGLMKGHFGKENTFDSNKHTVKNKPAGNKSTETRQAFVKSRQANQGAVYVVSGSSSYAGKPEASFPHAAMQYSNATETGAGILEVQGDQLTFKWICADGTIRDQFSIIKK